MAFTERLVKLREEEQLLLGKKKKIITSRKNEIGNIAERLGVLEISNAIIAGALLQIKNVDKEKLEGFEKEGERFLNPARKKRKNSEAADSNSEKTQ